MLHSIQHINLIIFQIKYIIFMELRYTASNTQITFQKEKIPLKSAHES